MGVGGSCLVWQDVKWKEGRRPPQIQIQAHNWKEMDATESEDNLMNGKERYVTMCKNALMGGA